MNRRELIRLAGLSAIAACNSPGPDSTEGLLAWVKRKNEKVERLLFRHDSMNRVSADARLTGDAYPRYFVSDSVPVWDEAVRGVWTLEVGGAVRTPLRLTLDDIMKLRLVKQRHEHFCVEGWNAVADWTGVRVSELARLAGTTSDAQYVDFQSFDDDYHESWDMESALHPQTLVCVGMDGHYLGPGHGAPARLHSTVKLGYKLTKYLTRVIFMPTRNGGYWTDQGYEWYAGT